MSLIDRAKNIILTPKTEWDAIGAEEATLGKVITTYIIPLALIPAIAGFIGYGLIGYSVPFFGKVSGISWGINHAIINFVSPIIGCIITAFVVDMLAPSFGSEKNMGRSAQLVAYSYTPALIGGALNILPMLGVLGALFGLYGIYLMYLGMPKMMKTPEDKVVVYMLVSILILIVVSVIMTFILGILMASVLGLGGLGGGMLRY